MRGLLLSWGDSCVERKRKRLRKLLPHAFLSPFGWREIGVFENCESLD